MNNKVKLHLSVFACVVFFLAFFFPSCKTARVVSAANSVADTTRVFETKIDSWTESSSLFSADSVSVENNEERIEINFIDEGGLVNILTGEVSGVASVVIRNKQFSAISNSSVATDNNKAFTHTAQKDSVSSSAALSDVAIEEDTKQITRSHRFQWFKAGAITAIVLIAVIAFLWFSWKKRWWFF